MHDEIGGLIHNGMQCLQQGMFPQAEAAFRRVLSVEPSHAPALHLLGLVYLQCGLLDDALGMLQTAVRIDGKQAAFRANLAVVHKRLGEREMEAAVVSPDSEAHIEKAEGCFDAALKQLDKAVRLQPGFANAHFNRGKLLNERGDMKQALQAMRKVVRLEPETYEAWNEIGGMLLKSGELAEAREAYLRAADCPRDGHKAYSNYLLCLNYDDSDDGEVFRAHREWEARYADPRAVFTRFDNPVDAGRRLRIGYVSADFHFHSVAYFAAPLIEAHDRQGFAVYCYSDSRKNDAMQQRIRAAADGWCDAADMDDAQLAARIRADGIDILVDLGGHTSGNRMRLFAMRPAPVQVTAIGYPNTTGLSAMHYRFTDAIADPPGAERFHSEQLVRLPGGFLSYTPPQEVPASEETHDAREGDDLRLGCFNILAKFSDECIRTWAGLLHRLPAATLVIKNISMVDRQARSRLAERFRKHGIPGRRLELLGWMPSRAAHYELYQSLDIALDTFPYNGTTTTCEALCMGVPVVTLAGDRHAARVGASLLARVGLDALVADDADDYVGIVERFAGDADARRQLRAGLAGRARSALCDAPRLVAEMQQAYRGMWRAWCEADAKIISKVESSAGDRYANGGGNASEPAQGRTWQGKDVVHVTTTLRRD